MPYLSMPCGRAQGHSQTVTGVTVVTRPGAQGGPGRAPEGHQRGRREVQEVVQEEAQEGRESCSWHLRRRNKIKKKKLKKKVPSGLGGGEGSYSAPRGWEAKGSTEK
jgi:hypothetical protein